jgi:hypothetical protein
MHRRVQIDKVNIGFAYPISTNGTHAAADTNYFSLNLIAGFLLRREVFLSQEYPQL